MTDLTKAETITVADGKYIISNNNGALTVLRNGEPWNRDLSGDNLVYWMFVEIQQLRAALAAQQAAQPVAWAESIEAAFRCGFSSPATYNDTLLNTADEAWEEEKSYLLAAQPQQAFLYFLFI